MRSCGLTGEIPDWISTQKTLGTLDLSENQLEGTFPVWLAEMNVESIVLSDNNLKGSLPPSLFNHTNLKFFHYLGTTFMENFQVTLVMPLNSWFLC
jgi:hypothetical protein